MNDNYFFMLSENEMLELWKNARGYTSTRRECELEREDGIDLDAKLLLQVRRWYATLLLTASPELLPVEDIVGEVSVSADDAAGCAVVSLPSRCIRVVEVHAPGWSAGVTVLHEPDSVVARLQHTPWLRAGECNPVVVDHGDRLLVYGGVPDSVRAVVVPPGHSYRFHASLLETIPPAVTADWQ